MEDLKQKIYERVESKFNGRVWITRLKKEIEAIFKQEVPLELIREIISEIKAGKNTIHNTQEVVMDLQSKQKEKNDWWLKDMVKWVWIEKKYDYIEETDHIVFYPEGKPYPVLRTTCQAMMEAYSKDGKNYSWKKMMHEFQLTPKARHYIKWVLSMYKDSVPFDMVTLSKMKSPEEMEKTAIEKAEQLTEAKMRTIYDKSINTVKNNIIRDVAKRTSEAEKRLDAILEAVKKHKPIDFWEFVPQKNKNNKVKSIVIADPHLWKKDTDWIVIRFKKITRDLIECEESEIDITCLWDLWEQFVARWEKHYGMKLWMEDINLEELFMLVLDVFEEMLLALYRAGKKVTFNWLGWNHDSFEANKDEDPLRSPAMIIYRLLEKLTKDTNIKVNILRDKINIVKRWKIIFIYLHWDWVGKDMVNRIIMNNMEDWYYIIIVTGDKHHFEIHEVTDRASRIQCSALAGKWKYDNDLWLSSQPWIIEFIKNRDGLIDVLVKKYK